MHVNFKDQHFENVLKINEKREQLTSQLMKSIDELNKFYLQMYVKII
jgi:hypothetical protein